MSSSDPPRAGFLPARVIHLHPSRFCNLACQHCYSASGPHVRGGLDIDVIIHALTSLRAEGYTVLSLSGGEPLLYSGFETIVRAAVKLDYKVNLITNGSALGGRLTEIIAQSVNLIAISLDGGPETHAQMRGDIRAFEHAERAMDRLAAKDIRYGIAYCLSQKSLVDMPWVVDFAAKKRAALVQFHPLASIGRGKQFANTLSLEEADKKRAYVIAALLDTGTGPAIQLDLAPVEILRMRRHDYTVLGLEDARGASLSDLVNPLIIDETGRMLPLCYGINSHYTLGQIGPDIGAFISAYKEKGWRTLSTLLNTSFTQLGAHNEEFVDWFCHVAETSHLAACNLASTYPN